MVEFTITAIGYDRPGIVAAVTRVLFDRGCNLADCSMTRLSGQFAMILLVQAPEALGPKELETWLEPAAEDLDLSIHVREAAPGAGSSVGQPFVLSLYGADKPGIVFGIAAELAARQANITDLVSRKTGENLYLVVLEIDLPSDSDPLEFEREIAAFAQTMGVEANLRAAEAAEL
ncbi:MAG: glycine cleavage system protein R [Actinomycetota bacterium]